jgi:hypothetical protein
LARFLVLRHPSFSARFCFEASRRILAYFSALTTSNWKV